MSTDAETIEALGGPAKVAELLGYDKDGGTQRVFNWMSRGIPSKVKLQRPDLFPYQHQSQSIDEAAQAPHLS